MELSQVIQTIREKLPEAIVEERPTGLVIKKESLLALAKFLRGENLTVWQPRKG